MIVDRHYDFEEIYEKANCRKIAEEIGLKISGDRCAAIWRGGENQSSVSINEKGFHDFGTGEKGGVIRLVALMQFNGDLQQAQQFLGDRLGLKPKIKTNRKFKHENRSRFLAEKGYLKKNTYIYKNARGEPVHIVERWEKGDKKEFVQKNTDGHEGIKNVKTVLYRLPEWIDSKYVCIVEGEKDVDNLFANGIAATTNASGAGRWEDYYNEWLKNKTICIIADADNPGKLRANFLLWELKNVAKELRLITFSNQKNGYDISDWTNDNGAEKLPEFIKSAQVIKKEKIKHPKEDLKKIQDAKTANKFDFSNYYLINREDEKGKETQISKPKQINKIHEDLNRRFLGFPKKLGNELFDINKKTSEIQYLSFPKTLFAWIQSKSGKNLDWKTGTGFVTKDEFYEHLKLESETFESISDIPDFPIRSDVYYRHGYLPEPDKNGTRLDKLIDFFSPASDIDRLLLKIFFVAPIYYEAGIPRPAWIIDSEDGKGVGKTTAAELCAKLYKSEPLRTERDELQRNGGELKKKLVSTSGRMKKIFLLDNVQGKFSNSVFSDLVTCSSISARAPYGRGEETRPNNLTYVITANTAVIDGDIADRSYFVFLKRSNPSSDWKFKVLNYIEKNRYEIFSDILYLLQNYKNHERPVCTRFPTFERKIVQPICQTMSNYDELIKSLMNRKADSNIEEEEAAEIKDVINSELGKLGIHESAFIRSEVIKLWFDDRNYQIVAKIKNLIRQGHLPGDKKIFMYPHNNQRRRGFVWKKQGDEELQIVGKRNGKAVLIL